MWNTWGGGKPASTSPPKRVVLNRPGTDVFRAYKQDKPNWQRAELVDINKVVESGHAILLKKFPKDVTQVFRTVFAHTYAKKAGQAETLE